MARATAALITAQSIGAVQALAWGMVTTLTEDQVSLDDAASGVARTIASKDPQTMRETKQLLRESACTDLAIQLNAEARAQTSAGHGPAYRSALTHLFKKKR